VQLQAFLGYNKYLNERDFLNCTFISKKKRGFAWSLGLGLKYQEEKKEKI